MALNKPKAEDEGGFEPEALASIQGSASAGIGHNSGDDGAAATSLTQAAREKLKQVVAKIEKLEEEKKEVAEEIRNVYQEAKSMGYDTKALRALVRLRKIDRQEREEQQTILEAYMQATGDLEFYD